MKNMNLLFAPLLVLTILSAPTASGQGKFYAGAAIGNTFFSSNYEDALSQAQEISENSTGWKIFAGSSLAANFGLEGGYRDFGTIETNVGTIPLKSGSTAWDIALMARFPIAIVDIFGKAGAIFLRNETKYGSVDEVINSSNFFWGLGAGVHLGPIGVRLEWESAAIETPENLSMVSLGATFGF